MTALYVVLGIVLAFWLIGHVRLGGMVEYSAEGLLVQLRIGAFRLTLYPPGEEKGEPRPKKEKKPKEKPAKERAEEKTPLTEKAGGAWRLFREAVPLAAEAAGALLRKLRIDELMLHLTWASEDPADAALGFGAGQAALGAVWPLLENSFDIRKRDVGVAVDFHRSEPIIYARGALSFTLGQLTAFGLVYGVKAMALFLRNRPKHKKKKPSAAQQDAGTERKDGEL